MRTIALEEHFVTQSFLNATGGFSTGPEAAMGAVQAKLLDLGHDRILAMDEAGIDLQVLSLAANGLDALDVTRQFAIAREVNDELAAATQAHPERFAGFATLALKDPTSAAYELERCVTKLGFKGAMLSGTVEGEFLDGQKFLPVFEASQALDVPIYLHPAAPPKPVFDAYYSGLPGETGHLLSIAGWGWHSETALHSLRLIVSGLFDRFPNLKIIIGHMGEGIPYALARSTNVLRGAMSHQPLDLTGYFLRNFVLTTSGYFSLPPLECALHLVGIDRLLFSVDYPFSPNVKGREFIDSLPLSQEDVAKLTHRNAERVLKIQEAT